MELTPEEEAAYNRAKQQHYLVREAAQQKLESTYHNYCVSTQIYWISIHLHPISCTECSLGEDHATLWYDLFHLHHALTPQAYLTLQQLFDRARPGVYKGENINLGEAGGYGTVPEYTAEKFAKALSDLFSDFTTHSPEMFSRVYPR